MAIILPANPTGAERFATQFGTGLGEGLSNLIKMKSQQLQTRHGLEAAGFAPEQASGLSQLPQELLSPVIKQKLQGTGVSPQDRRHQETLAQRERLAQAKEDFATQEKLRPFLHAKAQDYANAKKLYNKAKEMRRILVENKENWPNWKGYLPNQLQRNANVRKYIAEGNELVTLLAGSRRGQPTNYKIKLEQQSKPELSQPYDTQLGLLDSIIEGAEGEFQGYKDINKLKEQSGGKYPGDLETKLTNIDLARTDPLSHPEMYEEGTIYEDDGVTYIIQNGGWVEYNG